MWCFFFSIVNCSIALYIIDRGCVYGNKINELCVKQRHERQVLDLHEFLIKPMCVFHIWWKQVVVDQTYFHSLESLHRDESTMEIEFRMCGFMYYGIYKLSAIPPRPPQPLIPEFRYNNYWPHLWDYKPLIPEFWYNNYPGICMDQANFFDATIRFTILLHNLDLVQSLTNKHS